MSLGKLAKDYHDLCEEIVRLNREELRVSEQLKRNQLLQQRSTEALVQIAKNHGTQYVQVGDRLMVITDSGISYKELLKVAT